MDLPDHGSLLRGPTAPFSQPISLVTKGKEVERPQKKSRGRKRSPAGNEEGEKRKKESKDRQCLEVSLDSLSR